jgi:hypothetical protein
MSQECYMSVTRACVWYRGFPRCEFLNLICVCGVVCVCCSGSGGGDGVSRASRFSRLTRQY